MNLSVIFRIQSNFPWTLLRFCLARAWIPQQKLFRSLGKFASNSTFRGLQVDLIRMFFPSLEDRSKCEKRSKSLHKWLETDICNFVLFEFPRRIDPRQKIQRKRKKNKKRFAKIDFFQVMHSLCIKNVMNRTENNMRKIHSVECISQRKFDKLRNRTMHLTLSSNLYFSRRDFFSSPS